MGKIVRQIVSGAVSIPEEFQIMGYATPVTVTVKTPQGDEVDVPMDLTTYKSIDEYVEGSKKLVEATKKLEQV